VNEQVMEPDGRDGLAEGLERQAVVPGRQLELLLADLGARGDADAWNSTTLV